MQSSTDKKLSPSSVKVYSTRGGTSQKSWRNMNPSASSSRSCFVRELSVISPIWRRSWPNRRISHLPIYQRSSILYFPPSSFCTVEIVLHRLAAVSDFLIDPNSLPFHHTLFDTRLKGTSKKYRTSFFNVLCYNDSNETVMCGFASLPAHNSFYMRCLSCITQEPSGVRPMKQIRCF